MATTKRYHYLKPNKAINNIDDLLNPENSNELVSYPAPEFDDLPEFVIFLKETGKEIDANDQIAVSFVTDEGAMKKSFYVAVNSNNRELITPKLPDNIRNVFVLVKTEDI